MFGGNRQYIPPDKINQTNMTNIEANKKRKVKFIYECEDYIIEEIPLNYRATIKCAVNKKDAFRGIGRETYTHPEHGLAYAKEIVEYHIEQFFSSGSKPVPICKGKVA